MALIFIFLYAPILIMIAFSFNDSKNRAVWHGFTTHWYTDMFNDEVIMKALGMSLSVAVTSALFATAIGTAAAIGINNMKKRPQGIVMAVNNIPLVNPEIVTGISMMLLFVVVFRATGLLQPGYTTLLIAHITFCIPYVVLSVLPKLRQMNPHILEAAQDLGCPPLKAYLKVVMPEIVPGIITGAIMSFTLSLDDFVISYFTSGSTAQTLPVVIYAMTRKRVSPKINALSSIMFIVILLLLILINVLQIKDQKKKREIMQK